MNKDHDYERDQTKCYMGSTEERKGKEEMMLLYFNLKKRRN